MIFSLLADLVLVLHFIFILFAIFGAVLVYFYHWIAWLHIPMACWAILISFFGWICPLTYLEVWLRQAAGEQGYQTGFIAHYLSPIVFPEGFSREQAIINGAIVLLLNLAIYGVILFRRRNANRDE